MGTVTLATGVLAGGDPVTRDVAVWKIFVGAACVEVAALVGLGSNALVAVAVVGIRDGAGAGGFVPFGAAAAGLQAASSSKIHPRTANRRSRSPLKQAYFCDIGSMLMVFLYCKEATRWRDYCSVTPQMVTTEVWF